LIKIKYNKNKIVKGLKYSFLLITLVSLFSQFIGYGYSADTGIFDGLIIKHIHSLSIYPEEIPTNLTYTHISGDNYHVEWAYGGSINLTGTWDVNVDTRIVSNMQVFGPDNGSVSSFWIPINISLHDQVLSSCAYAFDNLYDISDELVIPYGNKSIGVWEITDAANSRVWFEKSTGILLNGTYWYQGNWETFKFVETNAVFEKATIPSTSSDEGIPGYNFIFVISMVCLIGIILIQYKSKKDKKELV
jgi:hypothetical protein